MMVISQGAVAQPSFKDLCRQRPAILGGPAAVLDHGDNKDLFHWPIVTEEDEQAVLEVLRSGGMSGTDLTKKFEAEYASWCGSKHALACCNGTAGLLAAMWACGVGAGDEVIVPSMTYWASAAPALMLGATVNFADIEPDSLCIDPNDIEHRVGPQTRAIVVVHYAGHPADMDRIVPLARKHGLRVIEDNSHAHGSLYKGRPCGTLGDIAVMSMMAGKGFAIGEAGMITTDDDQLFERCIAFGHYERTGAPTNFNPVDAQVHDPTLRRFAGLPLGAAKHRLNQTCAAMGRVQLKHYPDRIATIQRAMKRFWSLLEDIPGLLPHVPGRWPESTSGSHYFARGLYRQEHMKGLSCERFCEAVRAEGVVCVPGANNPLHLHPYFHEADIFNHGRPTAIAFGQRDVRQGPGALPVSEKVHDTVFSVPWFKHDIGDLIEQYAAAYRKVAENAGELSQSEVKA